MIKNLIKKYMMKNKIKRIVPFFSTIPYFCIEEDGRYKRIYIAWIGIELKYWTDRELKEIREKS